MSKDGRLEWDVPAGQWTILRLGYSLTGAKNRPAVPTGVRVRGRQAEPPTHGGVFPRLHGSDRRRLWAAVRQESPVPADRQLGSRDAELDRGDAAANSRSAAATIRLRTCRLSPGRIVESAEVSDRFLWDFRRTLADMFADNHYGVLAEMLRQRGMGIYAEAAGVSLEIPEDTLLNK